jgi:hypothetical protein
MEISNNCVNAVSFHPFLSIIFGVTGERFFNHDDDNTQDNLETDINYIPPSNRMGVDLWSEFKIIGFDTTTV